MANKNPKLIVLFEDKNPKEIPLAKKEYVLGRLPENDIPLKDEYISSVHSRLVKQSDGKYKIIDKNSTNGTFVNQKNVTEKLLENRDLIQLGRVQLKFNYETQESKSEEETNNHTDKQNRTSSKTRSLEEKEIKNKTLSKKKYLIIAIVGAIILVAILTNPNPTRHKEVIKNKLNSYIQKSKKKSLTETDNKWERSGQALGMMLGGAIVDRIIENVVRTDNYVFFSTTKISWAGKTKVIGIGAFGNVFVTSKLDEAMNKELLKNEQ